MQEVYDFLKKCGTYYLATVEGDQPRVRPFGTVDLFEGKLYIQTGKIKEVSKQMGKNPKIEISGMSEGKWIRVAATAVNDESLVAKQHMLDAYPSLQNMYKADDGNTQVLYLKDATATIYAFGADPVVYHF
ncbi:MAG: pyridoxamine 5'-phosphate oxidase family protein [Anaerofustis sp.]